MAKGKFYFSVHCEIHGLQNKQRGDAARFVVVSAPKHKRERKFGGCPKCYAVRKQEAKAQGIPFKRYLD